MPGVSAMKDSTYFIVVAIVFGALFWGLAGSPVPDISGWFESRPEGISGNGDTLRVSVLGARIEGRGFVPLNDVEMLNKEELEWLRAHNYTCPEAVFSHSLEYLEEDGDLTPTKGQESAMGYLLCIKQN